METVALGNAMMGILGLNGAELILVLVLILFLFAANRIAPSMSGLARKLPGPNPPGGPLGKPPTGGPKPMPAGT